MPSVENHDWDAADFAAIGLVAIPIITYCTILTKQHRMLNHATYRVQVLSTRTVLFLPTYAVLVWLTLVFPGLAAALEVPVSLAEACSFYGFLAMLITNLGGIDETLQLMTKSEKTPLCGCPKDPPVFYRKVRYALFQFLVYRPIVQVALAACIYVGKSEIGIVFSAVSLVQFLYGFLSLLCFYENVAEANANVYGGTKFILLKVAVGLIIGQGVVEEVLFATHALEVDGNDEYTAGEREQRYLALLILVEYCFLSMLAMYAFGSKISVSDNVRQAALEKSTQSDSTAELKPEEMKLSWCGFLYDILSFSDTLDGLEPSSSLTEKLISTNSEDDNRMTGESRL